MAVAIGRRQSPALLRFPVFLLLVLLLLKLASSRSSLAAAADVPAEKPSSCAEMGFTGMQVRPLLSLPLPWNKK